MKAEGPLLWTLQRAHSEFGAHRDTLKAKLDQSGAKPDADGKYTTQQIVAALFTSAKEERARLTREQADKLALENALTRRELVKMEDVERVWVEWVLAVRNAVKEQDIPAETKQAVLAAIRDVEPAEYFDDKETTDEGT